MTTLDDEMMRSLLKYDALHEAEQIRGTSYKDDDETTALGFVLMRRAGDMKAELLKQAGDTMFVNDLSRYLGIVLQFGFMIVYEEPFRGPVSDHDECFYILYHPTFGLLLSFDTYMGSHVNGGKVYYNWQPANEEWGRWTSSGHMTDRGVWVGDHDAREALLFNLRMLRENGRFIVPWIERPFLWLCHHGDREMEPSSDGWAKRKAVIDRRFASLPEFVLRGTI